MKFTIIVEDYAVGKNSVFYYPLNLQSCNIPSNVRAVQWQDTEGWIEFHDSPNETISELPVWAVACLNLWEAEDYAVKNPAPLSTEQLLQQVKAKAKVLLAQTDWAVLPDVGLANQDAFIFYRLNLRNLVQNPVVDPVWETMPEPVWS